MLLGNGDDAYNTGPRLDFSRERVDGYDVRAFFIPGTVLQPVGGGDFVPGVVEVVGA